MGIIKDDFSSQRQPRRWGLWLAVLLLHALIVIGLNAVLTLNRLAAQENTELQAVIVPVDSAPQHSKPLPAIKAAPPEIKAPEPESLPVPAPTQTATLAELSAPAVAAVASAASEPAPTVAQSLPAFRYTPPQTIRLAYEVTKGDDSAKASLTWIPSETGYDLTYEATYFGFSAIKQTSQGQLGEAGLMPIRFSDKRRGRSEQATHFERDKASIIFSNNRPDAILPMGVQDRVSVFVQLASIFSAEPLRFHTGDVIELPVASVSELETWTFEVQAQEPLILPIGEMDAVKLVRRPRRPFDPMVELWLSAQASFLPVRIRLTETSGITDQQLRSMDKP